jgi:molybdenum cofactor cytidylyltransferase
MMDARHICVAILAAGASRRFGPDDKLAAILHRKMLGLHIADTMSDIAFGKAIVVTASQSQACAPGWRGAGFEILTNPAADNGMSSSVALAATAAADAGSGALLICLADMPYVPLWHVQNIIGRFDRMGETEKDNAAITTGAADIRSAPQSPPTLFGRAHFAALSNLTGDTGGKHLTDNAEIISINSAYLTDVDTPEILSQLNHRAVNG